MKRNFETTLLKILYVIIALTSFMLIRQYSYTNNYNTVNNVANNTSIVEQQPENSGIHHIDGEVIYND